MPKGIYRRANKVIKICLICKKKFKVIPCRKNITKFCSRECRYKIPVWNKGLTKENNASLKKASKKMMGDKNPAKRIEVKEKIRNSIKRKYDEDPTYNDRVSIGTMLGMSKPEARKRYLIGYAHRRNKYIYSNTSIEIKIQNELKKRNIEFETQKAIIGIPDIFIKPNLCVFCDGDYWHNRLISKDRDEYVNKK